MSLPSRQKSFDGEREGREFSCKLYSCYRVYGPASTLIFSHLGTIIYNDDDHKIDMGDGDGPTSSRLGVGPDLNRL